MIDSLTAPPLNRVLERNSWARTRLAAFPGKCARFECAPFTLAFVVRPDGLVDAAAPSVAPDVTLACTPGIALRIAARDEAAWREVAVSGDTAFAEALNFICRNLRWDLEEDLARVFGDIAAHRMVETGETLLKWGGEAADNLARSFTEYWTEEQPLIARAADIEAFNRDVDRLRDDLARIEKRLERLA